MKAHDFESTLVSLRQIRNKNMTGFEEQFKVYIYIHTYVRTYLHTYVHTSICSYIHTYMHTYKCELVMFLCTMYSNVGQYSNICSYSGYPKSDDSMNVRSVSRYCT